MSRGRHRIPWYFADYLALAIATICLLGVGYCSYLYIR